MLFQPSNISPDEISGTGCIDADKTLAVSWQINGDSALTAYKIDIYLNDAASTPKYSTAKTAVNPPVWGVNYKGETQYYTAEISAAALAGAGIVNGGEYKLLITQWWGAEEIQQTTASVFIARKTPTVSINAIPSPVTGKAETFTAVYSQQQGDALKWVRWELAESGKETEPFLDTGKIFATGELQVDYDGFYTKTNYAIRCTVETANGIEATSGWVEFRVDYSVTPAQGSIEACQMAKENAVYVRWDRMDIAQGYSILRKKEGENVLKKVADADGTTGQIKDYGVRSGESYTYYVFPIGERAYLTQPLVSEPVQIRFWAWTIIEAAEVKAGAYSVLASHVFKMGSGGVSEGSFSNNNKPQILKSFSRYPTRQGDSSNYLSGSISGYVGKISPDGTAYEDNVDMAERIMALSTTKNALFLSDPKGHFLKIHTNSAVGVQINNKSVVMPQTVTVNWTEMGSTETISLYSAPGGDFFPSDAVIGTAFTVDTRSGALVWTVPGGYDGGSVMALNSEGELIQNADGAFVAAEMTIDRATMEITATVE